jgi:hypothetical protein
VVYKFLQYNQCKRNCQEKSLIFSTQNPLHPQLKKLAGRLKANLRLSAFALTFFLSLKNNKLYINKEHSIQQTVVIARRVRTIFAAATEEMPEVSQ